MEAWLSGLKQRTANALTLKRGPEVRILPPPKMKIINFFRSKNGDFEYAVCDDGNVYRRHLDKHDHWSEWEVWVSKNEFENHTRDEN